MTKITLEGALIIQRNREGSLEFGGDFRFPGEEKAVHVRFNTQIEDHEGLFASLLGQRKTITIN